MYTEEHYILEALRAGVKGCVSKTQAAEHLLQAIRDVCRGRCLSESARLRRGGAGLSGQDRLARTIR